MTRRRRPRRTPKPVAYAAWALVAGVVALGQAVDDRAEAERPTLATASMADAAPTPEPAPTPAPVAAPEPVHEPVRVVAAPPPAIPTPAPPKGARRPFAELHTFSSPLIMPRLRLPRAIAPRLGNVSRLLSRARPGEPVAVTLTAYCLDGTTRRGRPVRPGIIAADPRVFPLARHVELFAAGRYLGKFLVDDTGGQVRGRRIDIWTPDCDDARRFGTRDGIATLVAR